MIAQHSSRTAEHPTPKHVIEAARYTLGAIDLDPASSPEFNLRVGASKIFTRADEGLNQPWHGRVFLNPPGGRVGRKSSQAVWWEKLGRECMADRVDSAVFVGFTLEILRLSQQSAWIGDFPFCVPSQRLRFRGRKPTHANVIAYVGDDAGARRFVESFSAIGRVRV